MGVMEASAPRPKLRLHPRRGLRRWLRCKRGRHEYQRSMTAHEHNDTWRVVTRHCKHCCYIDDLHASRRP